MLQHNVIRGHAGIANGCSDRGADEPDQSRAREPSRLHDNKANGWRCGAVLLGIVGCSPVAFAQDVAPSAAQDEQASDIIVTGTADRQLLLDARTETAAAWV